MANKRGLSDVITNVLIILVVIVAVGIIAGFLFPLLKGTTDKSQNANDCLTIDTLVKKCEFVSNGANGFNVNVIVSRGAGKSEISEAKVILDKEDGATNITNLANPQNLAEYVSLSHQLNGINFKPSYASVAVKVSGLRNACDASEKVKCKILTQSIEGGSGGSEGGLGGGTTTGNDLSNTYNLPQGSWITAFPSGLKQSATSLSKIFTNPNPPNGFSIRFYDNASSSRTNTYLINSWGGNSESEAIASINKGQAFTMTVPSEQSYVFTVSGRPQVPIALDISNDFTTSGGIFIRYQPRLRQTFGLYCLNGYQYTARKVLEEINTIRAGIPCSSINQYNLISTSSMIFSLSQTGNGYNINPWMVYEITGCGLPSSPSRGVSMSGNNLVIHSWTPKCAN